MEQISIMDGEYSERRAKIGLLMVLLIIFGLFFGLVIGAYFASSTHGSDQKRRAQSSSQDVPVMSGACREVAPLA